MFLFKTDFSKQLITLLIISILIGTCLVNLGGYLTDKYFSRMVSGIIGSYGEYDLLLTISSEKEEIALEQAEKVLKNNFPGYSLKDGPVVVGSSNYLVKIPDELKNKKVYSTLHSTFNGIPGLLSTTIITEPRLSLRNFRGDSVVKLWDKLDSIKGVDFSYRISDGLDLVIKKPELIPEVKAEMKKILDQYRLFEIRYPLDRKPKNAVEVKEKIIDYFSDKPSVTTVSDVTDSRLTENMSLLKNLKQMKQFLLSYAARVELNLAEDNEIMKGSELIIPVSEKNKEPIVLKVVENNGKKITSILKEGKLENMAEVELYLHSGAQKKGSYLGVGEVKNPRADLARTLDQLSKIEPELNSFLEQSDQLAEYSKRLGQDLKNINQGLLSLKEVSGKLNENLDNWKKEDLSLFLEELLLVLDKIKANTGDVSQVQGELIRTSNKLKEAAGMVEERLIYIPRNNDIYTELVNIKELFMKLSGLLDKNYDIAAKRMSEVDPVIASIDEWEKKINSLLAIEENVVEKIEWQKLESVIAQVDKTASYLDTAGLEEKLNAVRGLLSEIKTGHLPSVIDQLEYIESSLPELEEKEIVDTIDLIDKYLAGRVIPGEQIQLLIRGDYDQKLAKNEIKNIIADPGVSFYDLEAGVLSTNPRTEIFNVLHQVRAVISTIIAFIFTLFIMFFDQSLLISVIRLNGRKGYFYSFIIGAFIFSLIYYLSSISFPYLNFFSNIIIGGIIGLITAFLADMLNPVDGEEWEAGKAMGFSFSGIMNEIIIPSGKPGLLYLLNQRKVIFK